MNYDFAEIFDLGPDGSAISKYPIRIDGTTVVRHAGTVFKPGVLYEGLDIAAMAGRSLKATIHEEFGQEVVVLKEFY